MLELVPFDINCDNGCGRIAAYSLKDGDKRIGDYCSLCADSVLKSELIKLDNIAVGQKAK